MISFICPVCKSVLERKDHTYRCKSGHSFDISKNGYVNLLPYSGSGHHGDDKLMVRSRRDFLNKGYYDPLSNAIDQDVNKYLKKHSIILDAGCGEGKYTYDLLQFLLGAGKSSEIIGIDISKDAILYAAKRSPDLLLAVASSSSIPLKDRSIDCVLNIFSPLMTDEFHRVLNDSGILLRVIPLENHLWELKELIYDKPYENDVPAPNLLGFELLSARDLHYQITLCNNEEVMALFKMTPYYYKTGEKDQKKAEQARELSTSISFRILIYQKRLDLRGV